ncbi:MAG: 1-acyl-sn-glycerol-3-phosphate acyltransferase [Bacteroidales bacterium]|nr:1-acyl-sn-glycerol-3-phosphate acyltransferase [Bacteroidales bacterium]
MYFLNHYDTACRKALNEKASLLFSPERTWTEDGRMGKYKEGAFILAKENNIPILPVIIRGISDVLPKSGWLLNRKQTFFIRLMDEVPVETDKWFSHEESMTDSGCLMEQTLNELR